MLIQQKKTTIRPPFDPNPLTVTEVKNNAVRMRRKDGTGRLRNKNQVKVLKERPKHLVPSWQEKGAKAVSDYDSFEIENSTITNDESESDNLF